MPYVQQPFDANQKVFTERESLNLLLVLFNAYIVPSNVPLMGDNRSVISVSSGRPKLPMLRIIVSDAEFERTALNLQNNPDVVAIFHHPDLDKQVTPQPGRVLIALLANEEVALR